MNPMVCRESYFTSDTRSSYLIRYKSDVKVHRDTQVREVVVRFDLGKIRSYRCQAIGYGQTPESRIPGMHLQGNKQRTVNGILTV